MKKTVVQAIKDSRKRKKLSQAELAKFCGMSQGDLSRIEQGHVDPRLSTLVHLTEALGLAIMLIPKRHLNQVKQLVEGGPEKPEQSLLEQYGIDDD